VEGAEQVWDASPLIGAVLIIPALLYLSFWWRQDWDYLRRALPAKALVYWVQVVHDDSRHTSRYTWVYFTNNRQQLSQGMIYGARDWATFGDEIDICYLPDRADIRFGGWRGIWGGLYFGLGTIAAGVLLSLAALWRARLQPAPDPATASLAEISSAREEWDL
jgi:hypothetical protein